MGTCSKIFNTIKKCFQNNFDEKPLASRCDIIGCPFWFFAFLIIWTTKKLCAYQSELRRKKPINKTNFCFDRILKWLENWVLKFFCYPCHTVTFGAWHNGIQPQIFKIIYYNTEIIFFLVTNYHAGKININLIVLNDLWSWNIWSKINCLTKKTLKFGFSVKRYSDRFSAIKSLNLIGFWILKMRLIRRDHLQPLEMIDLTF